MFKFVHRCKYKCLLWKRFYTVFAGAQPLDGPTAELAGILITRPPMIFGLKPHDFILEHPMGVRNLAAQTAQGGYPF